MKALPREEFEILVRGSFSRAAVCVDYTPGGFAPEPPIDAHIDRAWQTYLGTSAEKGIHLYNGPLFRLDGFERTENGMHLFLSDTDFRACIGTSSAEFASAFPSAGRANPLTVSVVVVTSDRKIVIEKRRRVDSRRRAYHVIAGYMERDKDPARPPHPFDTLNREVREELGIDLDEDSLSATGLIRTMYGSEICFRCVLDIPFSRLIETKANSETDSEIETLEALDDFPPAVAAFLASHPTDLVPSGRACLLLYGGEAYGERWYDENQRGRFL